MSTLHTVTKRACLMRGLTIAGMVILPVVIIGNLIAVPLMPERFAGDFAVSPDATSAQLTAAVALGLFSPLILIWTLNEMRKLFDAYSKGDILTEYCAGLIQRIGQGFLALAVVPFLLRPVQSVILTWANPQGARSLAVSLNSDMLIFALSGGLIIVIGWVMREASDVAAENRSFV